MKKNILILSLVLSLTLLGFQFVYAQTSVDNSQGTSVDNSESTPRLNNPIGGDRQLPDIIGDGIRIGLGVVGSIALALFVYGGFIMMTAGGNSQRVQKGKDVLVWATIGLIVIFTSYAILNFVLTAVTGQG